MQVGVLGEQLRVGHLVVRLGPVRERFAVDGEQCGEVAATLADDDRLGDQLVLTEIALDLLRGDVLPGGSDDQVLLAAGHREIAVIVEAPDVTRVQPSVGVDELRRRGLVAEVARAHVAAPHEDLAVVGDAHLHSREWAGRRCRS